MLIVPIIGFSIGLGAATVTDVLFFKFLKTYKVSTQAAEIMHTLSRVIWVALLIIIISGVCLYLPYTERYNETAKFLVKMIVVAVILINGLVLNVVVSPRLPEIFPGTPAPTTQLSRLRKLAFALGSISVTSWYSALVLGALRKVPFSFSAIILTYVCLLIVAICCSQITERFFTKKAAKTG